MATMVIDGVRREMTAEEIAATPTLTTPITQDFEFLMSQLRSKRNQLLADSDWTQFNDSPLTDAKKTEWSTYRTSLRDLTNGLTTVDDVNSVTWPTKPA